MAALSATAEKPCFCLGFEYEFLFHVLNLAKPKNKKSILAL
jgi:hypothetical protein